MFKVLIVGGKDTENYDFFEKKCISCVKNKAKTDGILIYSTGDDFVDKFCKKFGINVKYFYTDWKRYGNKAIKYRNESIFNDCQAVIIFDNGLKDTKMIENIAIERNLPLRNIKKN